MTTLNSKETVKNLPKSATVLSTVRLNQRLKPFLENNKEVIVSATNDHETAQKEVNKIIVKGSGLTLETLSCGTYDKQTTLFGIPVGSPETHDHILEAIFKDAKGSILKGEN